MNLYIFQETNPVSGSNVLVGAIYKKSAPSVLIASHVYTSPYTGQTQLASFDSLQQVVYVYICYESPDGSASGTIRNQFDVQPSNNAYQTRDDLYLTADTSSGFTSNTSTYTDASLIGWNWDLEYVGFGTREYGIDWTKTVAGTDTSQDDLTADGWRLIQTGAVFNSGDKYVLHFQPTLGATTVAAPADIITGSTLITDNTTLDNSAQGQSFLIFGTPGYLRVGLPAIATMTDGVPIYFESCGGNHINAGIFCAAGEAIRFNRTTVDTGATDHVYLGQNEQFAIYKYSPVSGSPYWVVLFMDAGLKQVGEQLSCYDKQKINTAILNGQLLSRSIYPRLWDWIQALESGLLIADSGWNTQSTLGTNAQSYYVNRGKFTTGDGSSTFRIPDLTLYGFQRAYGSVGSGVAQFAVGSIEIHSHTMHGSGTINGSGGPYYLGRNSNASYSGSGGDQFGRRPSTGAGGGPDKTMRTGTDNDLNQAGTQLETKPNTFGVYPLIRI